MISEFTCSENAGVVSFTGQVTGPNAAGLQVTIQGVPPSLQNGRTVTADSEGNFTLYFQMGPNDQGSVWATCVDCWGQTATAETYMG